MMGSGTLFSALRYLEHAADKVNRCLSKHSGSGCEETTAVEVMNGRNLHFIMAVFPSPAS